MGAEICFDTPVAAAIKGTATHWVVPGTVQLSGPMTKALGAVES